jgi:hypothetical protein
MNFSIYQWLFTIVLDFFLKAGIVYPIAGVGFGAAMVLGWWVIHFISLSLACGFVASLKLTRAAKFWLALIVSAILFAGCIVLMWILVIRSGHGTACTGFGFEMRCDWVNGEIMPSGVWFIALVVSILVAVNWVSILISTAFGRLASRIRRSLRAKAIVNG